MADKKQPAAASNHPVAPPANSVFPWEPKKNFPQLLYAMLSEVERVGQTHIVSWQNHGRCFKVHKQQEFVDTIMPKMFRQTKWSSFQRQLQIYGFKRLTSSSPDKGGYYHQLFLRGKESLCDLIGRTTIKGTKVRGKNPKIEPNFYTMPSVGGSPNADDTSSHSKNDDSKQKSVRLSEPKTPPLPFLARPGKKTRLSGSILTSSSSSHRKHQDKRTTELARLDKTQSVASVTQTTNITSYHSTLGKMGRSKRKQMGEMTEGPYFYDIGNPEENEVKKRRKRTGIESKEPKRQYIAKNLAITPAKKHADKLSLSDHHTATSEKNHNEDEVSSLLTGQFLSIPDDRPETFFRGFKVDDRVSDMKKEQNVFNTKASTSSLLGDELLSLPDDPTQLRKIFASFDSIDDLPDDDDSWDKLLDSINQTTAIPVIKKRTDHAKSA